MKPQEKKWLTTKPLRVNHYLHEWPFNLIIRLHHKVMRRCFCEDRNKPQQAVNSSPASELQYVDGASLVCPSLQEASAEPQLHPSSSNRKPGLSHEQHFILIYSSLLSRYNWNISKTKHVSGGALWSKKTAACACFLTPEETASLT